MKLYFYFMEVPFKGAPYVRFEECEVIEKPKTYYPVEKFPEGFYGSYVRKDDIGHLCSSYSNVVILTENNQEIAMELFANKAEIAIKAAEYNIEVAKSKLLAIEKFRKESEE